MKNCLMTGWSRPIVWRIWTMRSGVAPSPAMMMAGSPGLKRNIAKTTTATITRTGMVARSRRETNASMYFPLNYLPIKGLS